MRHTITLDEQTIRTLCQAAVTVKHLAQDHGDELLRDAYAEALNYLVAEWDSALDRVEHA